jgi:hypothetical protein
MKEVGEELISIVGNLEESSNEEVRNSATLLMKVIWKIKKEEKERLKIFDVHGLMKENEKERTF